MDRNTGCVLAREVEIPAGEKTALHLVVGHDPKGDWTLVVKADGKALLQQPVSQATATGGWLDVRVDLSAYAGRKVQLELVNQPSDWAYEAGYWAEIAVDSR